VTGALSSTTGANFATSSGNVGIGTSSPAYRVTAAGSIAVQADNTVIFADDTGSARLGFFKKAGAVPVIAAGDTTEISFGHTNAASMNDPASQTFTERMRIDSSGNLLAGTTTNVNARLHLNYEGVNGATAPIGISLRTAESASTTAIQFVYTPGPDQIGTIAVTSTATAYNTSSDARLKTNIRDYSPGALIDSLQPRMFDWKSGEKDSIGFVAQELQAVYPQAVTAGDDGEEIERSWGVDFAKLVPLLVAEVKALRARVAQLESNA